MNRSSLSLVAAIGWFLLTTVLLTLPGADIPKEDWLDNIKWFDKLVHIGLFAVMTVLWCWSRYSAKKGKTYTNLKQAFIIIGLIWIGYGVAMEFVQKYFVPGRTCDIGDMIADAIGCVVGVLFSTWRYIKK